MLVLPIENFEKSAGEDRGGVSKKRPEESLLSVLRGVLSLSSSPYRVIPSQPSSWYFWMVSIVSRWDPVTENGAGDHAPFSTAAGTVTCLTNPLASYGVCVSTLVIVWMVFIFHSVEPIMERL